MRRADRLFDIIQTLRSTPHPLTAAAIADRLEVATRTVYRDIATLQARRIPIEGAPGIGYMLRRGFDLPPLMFNVDEVEAITVGARLLIRLRDAGLQKAAESVLEKVATVLPEPLRQEMTAAPLYVSEGSAAVPEGIELSELRRAIRETRKLRITYVDKEGQRTNRTIWPVAMAYYVDVTVVAAWCELRQDFRHFRVERIVASNLLAETFPASGELVKRWLALPGKSLAVR